jgi:hypothetical protein
VSTTAELWDSYQAWCAEGALEAGTKGRFMAALRKAGHVTVQGMSRYRVGVALRPAPDPDTDVKEALATLRRGGLLAGYPEGDGGKAWQARLQKPLLPPRPFREEDWQGFTRSTPLPSVPPDPVITGTCCICGGAVLETSNIPDCHPACQQWPQSGRRYGPEAAS